MMIQTPHLECHKCRTRYRVRNPKKLKDRAKATCGKCGTRFIVVALPDARQTSLASDISFHRGQPQGSDKIHTCSTGSQGTPQQFSFHGIGGSLFGIQIVNVFLTLLTLGLYHFWAKVRVRKYLFSQSECAGDRFAYHGTGRELLVGFLRACIVFGIPYVMLAAGPEFLDFNFWVRVIAQVLAGILLIVFVPVAVASARRYRLSRTSWRGIRFSFRGRTWEFLILSLKGVLLTALTLGAYYPYFQTQRQAFLTSHSYFGTQRFHFEGHGSALAPSFVLTFLLTPLAAGLPFVLMQTSKSAWSLLFLPFTLGPLWIWFIAKKQRYFWDHTSFGTGRFRSTVTWRRLLNLQVANLFLLVLTLGFGWPWVTVRNARFQLDNLSFVGSVDLDQVQQEAQQAATTGEGLANLLDTGFDLD